MTSSLFKTESDANRSLSPESVSSYSNNLSNSLESEIIKSNCNIIESAKHNFPGWDYNHFNTMSYMKPTVIYNDENDMRNSDSYMKINIVQETDQQKTPIIDYYNCKSEHYYYNITFM